MNCSQSKTSMTSNRHRTRNSRGAALMAVLWLIAILSMACMATLRVISFDMKLASAKVHGSRARQIAEMGIAVGCNPVVKRDDPILKQRDADSGEGFEVTIVSEGGRFNINYILLQNDKELLKQIFISWGLELDAAQDLADALKDWVDADENEELRGAEVGYYEKQGRFNQPFNRPFYDLGEMSLVRGMDMVEAVKPDWRNWFTIWSGGALDVNEASAELIAVAADLSVDRVDIIPETVRGTDGIRDTEDDVPYQNAAAALDQIGVDTEGNPQIAARFTANDATTRVESIGYADGTKRKITAILANRTGRPALLERTEEIIP